MTRRDLFAIAGALAVTPEAAQSPLLVPLRRVMDSRAQCTPQQLQQFWYGIWPEAVQDFGRCGIRFQTTDATGEIRRSPGGRPLFRGVERGTLNMVLTDHIPMAWDRGRAVAGITTIDDGYHLSVIALQYAHGHRIPFVSTNTCVHEFLHALLGDIFVRPPRWYQADEREYRIDWDATLMWLFHDGAAVREAARAYLRLLRPAG